MARTDSEILSSSTSTPSSSPRPLSSPPFVGNANAVSLDVFMAFLGLFKRDKHRPTTDAATDNSAAASDLDPSEPDYVLPSPGQSPYSGPPAASSSKLKLVFKPKKPAVSQPHTHSLPPPSPSFLNGRSESENNLLSPPPLRSAIFSGYNDPASAHSTRSLPAQPSVHSRSGSKDLVDPNSASSYAPPKKGLFSWAHRDRKKSRPPPPSASASPPLPDISLDVDSFNLRSFRHIRPESPTESPISLVFQARPRLRDTNITSDTSQRISVAAFREAQARRSAANSPVPSFTNDIHSPGPPSGLRPPSLATSALRNSTSVSGDSDPADSTDEDEDKSEASSTLKPRRNRSAKHTKTSPVASSGKKSVSELGHKSVRPSPSPVTPRIAMSPSANAVAGSSQRDSPFARPRASASTSALQPSVAARRASVLAAQQQHSQVPTEGKFVPPTRVPAEKARSLRHRSSSSTSSSSSSDSDSDAPLVSLVGPKRPGSAASSASRARAGSRLPTKPLIDLSGLTPPTLPAFADLGPSPLPSKDSPQASPQSYSASRQAYKSCLNDRLVQLAKDATSPSAENRNEQEKAKHAETEGGRERGIPKRSQTQQPESPSSTSTSPLPAPTRKPNGRSMSSPNATLQAEVPSRSDPPIAPTAIRMRTPPPAFAVTSRPPSQVMPQTLTAPRTSEETVRIGRARASTLISDGDLVTDKGFTGTGLLARGGASSPSTAPISSGVTRPRPRAETMVSSSSPSRSSFPTSIDVRSRSSVRPSRSPSQDLSPPRLVGRSISPESQSTASTTSPPTSVVTSGSRTTFTPKSAMKSSSQQSVASNPTAERSHTSFATPVRPFAGAGYGLGLRGNSPASSTGDSSSGRTPITPVDGSDLGSNVSDRKLSHRKSSSVTFDMPDRGRLGLRERERPEMSDPEESRRRERRRSEAKAALELGKIVNGRGPINLDDEGAPENMGPRMSMFNPMMAAGMGPMGGMNISSPMNWAPQTPQGGMNSMFPMTPQSTDTTFLAAHQQAMMAAKQAFQLTIAQQALAAANDEWERGSNATSAFGGFSGMGGGMFPAGTPAFGMNGGMGMPWGMQMFPSSQSMYAGSVVGGSELGINPSGRNNLNWSTRTAHGDQGGYLGTPAERASMALRNSQYGGVSYGSGARSEIGGPTSGRGQRPRTKTNPSDAPVPSPARNRTGGPPPSSWNVRTNRPA